jgi:fused signal recognition particle receptor
MIFKRLFKGLAKTRTKLSSGFKSLFSLNRELDDDFIDELEEILYLSDMGGTAVRVIDRIKEAYKNREIKSTSEVYDYLKSVLREIMVVPEAGLAFAPEPPTVILIVGVNGCGKTTSIAKLGHLYAQEGKKVVFGACDTFRAAAVEQLTLWSERIGAEIVKQETGGDPAAVAFDAVSHAIETGADVVIVDTAGRLHTQQNLMQELEKIKRVIAKKVPDAPHEVLLVLDATTGQNAVVQASHFTEAVNVTGLFLAKLDGTAKGGAVVSIREQVQIPVKFVGVGESYEDVEYFDAAAFVDAMME